MRATTEALTRPGHAVVFYDDLVSDTETILNVLCEIIGVEFEDGMDIRVDPTAFIQPDEGWKSQVTGPIRPSVSKLDELFDAHTQSEILHALETERFEKLKHARGESRGGVLFSGTGVWISG
jgi:hypothetical protein